jgi:ABC-2 type transport system permease protein
MSTALAFVKRDASMALSYRLSFAFQFLGSLVMIATFYFLSQVLSVDVYGGDPFAFILIGLAFSRYMTLSMSTFSNSIREGQMMGTLEIMLLSPTRLSKILLSSSIWAYLFTSLQIVLFLALGVVIFGVDLGGANVVTALIVLALSIVSFAGIGMISAAFIMVLKKGDPIAFALSGLSVLLAGVYYPVDVLPGGLQAISKALPLTYSLEGTRGALQHGYTLSQTWPQIQALIIFAVVLVPLAFLAFRMAVKRARAEGTLVHY